MSQFTARTGDLPIMEIGEIASETQPAVTDTHCATVGIIGDLAYKVKKPLDLGYGDWRSPEARRTACHREIALNRIVTLR